MVEVKKYPKVYNKTLHIGSPVRGRIVLDEEKQYKLVFVPESNEICSPVTGTVTFISSNYNVVCIDTIDGVSVVLNFMINELGLNDHAVRSYIQEGQDVNKGDIILSTDIVSIKNMGYDPVLECGIVTRNPYHFMLDDKVDVGTYVIAID